MKDNSVGRRLVSALLALGSGSTVISATAAPVRADTATRKAEAPRISACTIVAHRILA